MGYGALSDEQTSMAMERSKVLKKQVANTYNLKNAQNTKKRKR